MMNENYPYFDVLLLIKMIGNTLKYERFAFRKKLWKHDFYKYKIQE